MTKDTQYIPSKAEELHLTEVLRKLGENLSGLELKDVGSTAKGTWLAGASDIDIYVVCDNIQETHKRIKGLFPNGHDKKGQLTIWNFLLDGYDVDLVIVTKNFHKREDTLLHASYFNRILTQDMKNEVRKAKAFFKTHGVYGAENGGIVGVALEALMIQAHNLETLCGYLKWGKQLFVQDPTMTEKRNLLASVNDKRWKQIQRVCKDYLNDKPFSFKPMSTNEFHDQYKWTHCTMMFYRKYDKGLDYQTITSTANKISRMLRNQDRDITIDIDAFVDNEHIILCYRVRPLQLSSLKEVCVGLQYAKAFKDAHPNAIVRDDKVCADVRRPVVFPDTAFITMVVEAMELKGYTRF